MPILTFLPPPPDAPPPLVVLLLPHAAATSPRTATSASRRSTRFIPPPSSWSRVLVVRARAGEWMRLQLLPAPGHAYFRAKARPGQAPLGVSAKEARATTALFARPPPAPATIRPAMPLTVVDHPLAQHLLTQLRDVGTPPPVFRTIAKRLTILIVLEAVRGLPTVELEVDTPLERTSGRLISPDLVAVPILRAGLGMLEAVTELFPEVSVGYIGLERDDTTLLPTSYYEKMPPLGD